MTNSWWTAMSRTRPVRNGVLRGPCWDGMLSHLENGRWLAWNHLLAHRNKIFTCTLGHWIRWLAFTGQRSLSTLAARKHFLRYLLSFRGLNAVFLALLGGWHKLSSCREADVYFEGLVLTFCIICVLIKWMLKLLKLSCSYTFNENNIYVQQLQQQQRQ